MQQVDIFQWANEIDGIKSDYDIELFLFNKNYTPYSTNFASDLNAQIKPLFLFDLISFVNLGAGAGLSVCDYENSDNEENILPHTNLSKVSRAETLIQLIEKERQDIIEFNEAEHEIKRMKGIIARFTYKNDPDKTFYVIKGIPQSRVLSGATVWEFRNGRFGQFEADAVMKMPEDNQVLIVGEDIFIFNTRKFEKLFNYDYKKQTLADRKIAEIEKHYKLSFPEGINLTSLARDRKKTINKLQKLEVGVVTQEQVIEYADEMQLELMSDENGAIIVMEGTDLDTFLNLINEDYITGEVTGRRYEVKSKKLIDPEN